MQLVADSFSHATENNETAKGGDYFRKLRRLVHRRLIDSLHDEGVATLGETQEIKERVQWIVDDLKNGRGAKISSNEYEKLECEILQELGGMGPLATLMLENDITDILINGASEVWVDRGAGLERTEVTFDDDAHLRRFLDRILANQGRHLDSSNPMVDAKLTDGSRLHAVIPPLCNRAAVVSIRRFRTDGVSAEELVASGFMNKPMLEMLQMAVDAGVNIVVAGSAGAGKTTLLNALSKSIPEEQRIITIEETAELRLEHPHVISLESRQSNMEGVGKVNLRDLVKTSLRMRADRIIVGEVRGGEVMDMLQAMNIGHNGSMTTVHANSSEDVLRRLEALALMNDAGVPRESVRDMIGSAVQLVVHVTRFRDGIRRVTSIDEVVRKGEDLSLQTLFRFQAGAGRVKGSTLGAHLYTGVKPAFLEWAKSRGYSPTANLTAEIQSGAPQ